MKKINNYHIFILILIVFILNTILFKSIDLTFAQFPSPPGTPGEQETNIVVNPLQEDLDLGGQSIIGEGLIIQDNAITVNGDICDSSGCIGSVQSLDVDGDVGIDGNLNVNSNLDVSGDFRLGSIIKSGYWSWAHSSGDSSNKWVKIGSFVLNGAYNNMGITWTIFPTNSNHGDSNERISVQFRNHSTAGPESTYSIEHEIWGDDQYSIKDVRVISTSGSGLGPYNYSIWVQANASWLGGVPWTAQYEGSVTLNSGSLTQYQTIPDTGIEYNVTSIFSNINGNITTNGSLNVGGDIECTDCIDSGEIADGAVNLLCTTSGQNTVVVPPYTIDYVYGNSCASGYTAVSADCIAGWPDLRITASRVLSGQASCRFYNEGGNYREIHATTRCCKLTM